MSLWAEGFLVAQRGGHRLAEGGSEGSEARPGGEAEEILPRSDMVDSKTETSQARRGGWRRSGCFGRFGKRR